MSTSFHGSSVTVENYREYFEMGLICFAAILGSVGVAILPISSNVRIVAIMLLGLLPIAISYLRSGDIFSPPGFFGLSYLLGWIGPVIDYSQFDAQDQSLLLGNEVSYLLLPLVVTTVGVASLLTGYHSKRGDQIASRIISPSEEWDSTRALIVVTITFILGLISFAVFVKSTGGIPTSLSDLSAKRRPPTEYIRWGAQFLSISVLVYFTDILEMGKTLVSRYGLRLAILLFVAVLFPFYSSQRGAFFSLFILILVIYHYLRRALTIGIIGSIIPVFALFSGLMLSLRKLSWQGGRLQISGMGEFHSVFKMFDANAAGITILAHIVHSVPESFNPRFGSTFIKWILYPIPRSFWPGKPRNLGQVLGEVIYNQGVGVVGGGTPPSVLGELYLNFLLPGVIIGMYVLGILVRAGYTYTAPQTSNNASGILLYGTVVIGLSTGLLSVDFTHIMVNLLRWLVPVVPALAYITHGFGR